MIRLGPPRGAVDSALGALIGLLIAVTAVVIWVPEVTPAAVDAPLDVALVTASTLVALAVAALEEARGRVAHDGAALLRGSAFAVLGLLNLLTLSVQLADLDSALGLSIQQPGQLPLITTVVARGVAALLLVLSGVYAVRRLELGLRPLVLFGAPLAFVAGVIAAAAFVRDGLPQLVQPDALARLAAEPNSALSPADAPVFIGLQSGIALGFMAAAALAYVTFRRTNRTGDALLSAGLVIAAFSQLHGAIHPGSYSSLVTSGDILRFLFYTVLLGAIVADRRDDLRELRLANLQVKQLAEAQLETAALEERARLAREIHDGLAQDLWYAKLKQSRLSQLVHSSEEAQQLNAEVGHAIDAALAEARNAIAAMRVGAESGAFIGTLERQVEDFADRFAMRADFTVDGVEPHIGPRQQAELLRIVQEALNNVRKHADATVVRVTVRNDGMLRITIADNGRGFEPRATAGGFGLESMRQRASLIGAELAVQSQPHDGTRVHLAVPLEVEGDR